MSVKGVPRAVVPPAPLTGKWTETGATLSRITVYPLKSGMGIDVKEAEVTCIGKKKPLKHEFESNCVELLCINFLPLLSVS